MGLTVDQARQGLLGIASSDGPYAIAARRIVAKFDAHQIDGNALITAAEGFGVKYGGDDGAALASQVAPHGPVTDYTNKILAYNRDPRAIAAFNKIGRPDFDVNNPAHIEAERGGHVTSFEVAGA